MNQKAKIKLTSLLLSATLVVTLFTLGLPGTTLQAKAEESALGVSALSLGESRQTQTAGNTPQVTPFALGDYDLGDVAVVNAIIDNNKLAAAKDDPDNWNFAEWDASAPKRLITLNFNHNNLSGRLDVSGLTNLYYLFCDNNQLASLDVKSLTKLKDLTVLTTN